jgi:hypothetical protein
LFQPHELQEGIKEGRKMIDLNTRKETVWQLPDFATEEYLLKKAKKTKNIIIPEKKEITLFDSDNKEHTLTRDQYEEFKREKDDFVDVVENKEEKDIAFITNTDKEVVVSGIGNPPLPWVREEPITLKEGEKVEYSPISLPNGEVITVPHVVEEEKKEDEPPKRPPRVVYNPKPKEMPFAGQFGIPYQYPFGYQGYGYGYNNPQAHQALPEDIDQIDFLDKPDPFSSYK